MPSLRPESDAAKLDPQSPAACALVNSDGIRRHWRVPPQIHVGRDALAGHRSVNDRAYWIRAHRRFSHAACRHAAGWTMTPAAMKAGVPTQRALRRLESA